MKAKIGDRVRCVPTKDKSKKWNREYWGKEGIIVEKNYCKHFIGTTRCKKCLGGGEIRIKLDNGETTAMGCWGHSDREEDYYTWELAGKEAPKEGTNALFIKEFEEGLFT